MLRSLALAGLLATGTTASALAEVSTAEATTPPPAPSAGQSEPGCHGGLGPLLPSTLQVDERERSTLPAERGTRVERAPAPADCALA